MSLAAVAAGAQRELPLWPVAMRMPVGSPIRMKAGLSARRDRASIIGRTPRQLTSSSQESARCMGRASGACAAASIVWIATATKPFMSVVPRP